MRQPEWLWPAVLNSGVTKNEVLCFADLRHKGNTLLNGPCSLFLVPFLIHSNQQAYGFPVGMGRGGLRRKKIAG